MKKYFVVFLLIFMSIAIVYAANDAGEFTSVTVQTHMRVELVFDTNASMYDSLYLCYRILNPASTDTTFLAYIDSATTDTALVALEPKTVYEFFTLARSSTGATNLSTADTVLTYKVQPAERPSAGRLYRKVATDASWPLRDSLFSMDYVFDLNGADAYDYSLIYYAKDYNGLDAYVTQASDSLVATVYFYPVYIITALSDTTFARASTIADSVNITASGFSRTSFEMPVGDWFQMYIYSLADNGKDSDYQLYLTSVGGDE